MSGWKQIDDVFKEAEEADLRRLVELAQEDEEGQEEGESDGREDSATGRDEARETHEAREA